MTVELRSCSNCANWSAYSAPDPVSGTLGASCALDGLSKRGSDKCSKWAVKRPVVAAPDEEWMYFG